MEQCLTFKQSGHEAVKAVDAQPRSIFPRRTTKSHLRKESDQGGKGEHQKRHQRLGVDFEES